MAVTQTAVSTCSANAASGMATTGAMSSARSQHQHCVDDAFASALESLCDKATAMCAQASAPADVCNRVATACTTP
jgi:hypothetical protein